MKRKIYLAGGCFWCMVAPFEFDGVKEVISGYMGGSIDSPTYNDVKEQTSGHYEVVSIEYDDSIIPLSKLLDAFWRQIDPTDAEGQFQDRGSSYRTAIFYEDEDQKVIAEYSKKKLELSKRFDATILTPIIKSSIFYKAEDYHQNYHLTHKEDYKLDRSKSGRDEFISKYWGEEYWEIYD